MRIFIVSGIFVAFVFNESEAFFFGNSQRSNGGGFSSGFSPSSSSYLGPSTNGFGQEPPKENSLFTPLSGGYNYDPPAKLSSGFTSGFTSGLTSGLTSGIGQLTNGIGQGFQSLTNGLGQGHQGRGGFNQGQQSQNSFTGTLS